MKNRPAIKMFIARDISTRVFVTFKKINILVREILAAGGDITIGDSGEITHIFDKRVGDAITKDMIAFFLYNPTEDRKVFEVREGFDPEENSKEGLYLDDVAGNIRFYREWVDSVVNLQDARKQDAITIEFGAGTCASCVIRNSSPLCRKLCPANSGWPGGYNIVE